MPAQQNAHIHAHPPTPQRSGAAKGERSASRHSCHWYKCGPAMSMAVGVAAPAT